MTDRVNPMVFFEALRSQLANDAMIVCDDGNHTFLTAELLEIRGARQFICPTNFNSMGYGVPAVIGAKLVNPQQQVVGIVGDGAFLMTGMELLTAKTQRLGVVIFVFNDGELSQISQGQEIPYNRKTCTILGDVRFEGLAAGVGAHYVSIARNDEVENGIGEALAFAAKPEPVIVDVRVDYSKRTRFTEGVVKTVLERFSARDKVRFVTRAGWRRVRGSNKKSS
jgi:acetolactate synthase-1/2/3 large subunit